MTDPIVTLLREQVLYVIPEDLNNGLTIEILKETIEYIERLQSECNLWMGAAERFAESHPQFEAFHYYFKARRQ
jgi:hypothetical protein